MVEAQAGEGLYMCRFSGNPPYSQIVSATNMDAWAFFDNEEHLSAWVAAQQPPEPPKQEEPPAELDTSELERAIEHAAAEAVADAVAEAVEELATEEG